MYRAGGMIGLQGMDGVKAFTGAAAAVLLLMLTDPPPALADTIEAALVRAYQSNPQLNAQRAQVRATDENVPQALSGYRPKVAVTASAGYQYTDTNSTFGGSPTQIVRSEVHGTNPPRSAGLTVTQTLYNGNQTANKTRAAESQVSGSREALRVLEQSVLLSAATVYMDELRDAAIVEVQNSNVRVLDQTLKQTRDRFNVGEVTRTDVAQSEAQLAAGKTQLLAAEATLTTTRANFRRIIGNEPQNLAPGSPVDRYLPAALPAAVELSSGRKSERYGGDVRHRRQLSPGQGERGRAAADGHDASLRAAGLRTELAGLPFLRSIGDRAGLRSDISGRCRVLADFGNPRSCWRNSGSCSSKLATRLRANTVTAWGQLVAGKAQVVSAQAQVTASEIALNGVREEAKAGQRTTLDVLNAQQALVNARVALVTAQHDRVVASYGVLTAVGRLAPQVLGLATTVYDPSIHYHQVRDSWYGVRTPDGR